MRFSSTTAFYGDRVGWFDGVDPCDLGQSPFCCVKNSPWPSCSCSYGVRVRIMQGVIPSLKISVRKMEPSHF